MIYPFISSLAEGVPLKPEGSKLVIAEWIASGTAEGSEPELIAPLHKHLNDDETWYVLEGTLGFQIGDTIVEANAGDAVTAASDVPHTYWNPKPHDAKYLIIMTARIHELIEAIHHLAERDNETLKALFRSYDSELL